MKVLFSEIHIRGYSGAPIINSEGKCVGVLYGGYKPENGQTQLIYSPIIIIQFLWWPGVTYHIVSVKD